MMLTRPPRSYDEKTFLQILTQIDQRLERLEQALNAGNYQVFDQVDSVRELNVATGTLDDVKKVLGTLITDFRTVGRIK